VTPRGVSVEVVVVAGGGDGGLVRRDAVVALLGGSDLPSAPLVGGDPEDLARSLAGAVVVGGRPAVGVLDARRTEGGGVTITYLVTTTGTPVDGTVVLVPLRDAAARDPIVAAALERLDRDAQTTDVILSMLPETFTLGEIISLYEGVWGVPLDRRNFRRRMVDEGRLERVGLLIGRDAPGRPPVVYRAAPGWRTIRRPGGAAD
jgi:hypothetical protein